MCLFADGHTKYELGTFMSLALKKQMVNSFLYILRQRGKLSFQSHEKLRPACSIRPFQLTDRPLHHLQNTSRFTGKENVSYAW